MLSCPEENAQAESVLAGRVVLEMMSKETARYLFLLRSQKQVLCKILHSL